MKTSPQVNQARSRTLPYRTLAIGFLIAYLVASSITWAPSAQTIGNFASLILLIAAIASAAAAIKVAISPKK